MLLHDLQYSIDFTSTPKYSEYLFWFTVQYSMKFGPASVL